MKNLLKTQVKEEVIVVGGGSQITNLSPRDGVILCRSGVVPENLLTVVIPLKLSCIKTGALSRTRTVLYIHVSSLVMFEASAEC